MNRQWNSREIIDATKGVCAGNWTADRVVIDSRIVKQGDIFIALVGETFDGHDYVESAFAKGAVAAIVSHLPKNIEADDARLVMVKNSEVALQALGVYARANTSAQYIGITGSVGKTGCKEMLRTALHSAGSVYATSGNYNNHLGVPLTLANMPIDTDFAVIEMGMNHAGEITQLTDWVKPDIAIITTIEAVHIENFDTVEGIADAKSEIFSSMQGAGVAVINSDNAHCERLKKAALKQDIDRILTFGTSEDALCHMKKYSFDDTGSTIDAVVAGTPMQYTLGTIGTHWGLMSVAVLGIVDALHANIAKAAEALAHFVEPEGRGSIAKLPVKGGYLRLIDDSYNASPASMEAAFEKMHALKSSLGGRTVAVLGDMFELGDESEAMHLGLAPTLVNNQIDLVFTAGQFMQQLYFALPEDMRGAYDATSAGLAPKVVQQLRHKDIVLVKGSNGSKMKEVVNAIEEHSGQYALPLTEESGKEGEADAV